MSSNINIQNNVNSLALTTNVGGGLESSAYTINTNSAPALQFTNYLTFNRDEGIKNGHTYTFTTSFSIGNLAFTIQISLTGTTTSSNFWIQVGVGNGPATAWTPQISDVGTTYLNDSNDNGALQNAFGNGYVLDYSVNVQRFLNGAYDDVTITLNPAGQWQLANNNA